MSYKTPFAGIKVVDISRRGKIVGRNDFGEEIKGSAAIVDGALYVRSDGHLWKIASTP